VITTALDKGTGRKVWTQVEHGAGKGKSGNEDKPPAPDFAHDPELQRRRKAQEAADSRLANLQKMKSRGINALGIATSAVADSAGVADLDKQIEAARTDSTRAAASVDEQYGRLKNKSVNWSTKIKNPKTGEVEMLNQAYEKHGRPLGLTSDQFLNQMRSGGFIQ
jgi:hypothetical protein